MMDRLRHHLRDAAAVVLLCLLVIACTWRIGLVGRVLAGGDIFTYFYPYWAEATRAIRAARLPLWNPSLFMGVPFVANSQVGFFYPLNWPLWLLLPAHRSVHVTIVLHLCLAAFYAYLWGRRSLCLGPVAAWTVGAVVSLGGYMGAQVEHVNQLQGLAWLPLMLMLSDPIVRPRSGDHALKRGCATWPQASEREHGAAAGLGRDITLRSRRLRCSCVLGLVIALVLLAGHTQTAFISLFGVAVYGLGPLLWRTLRGGGWRPVIEGVGLFAVATMSGVALAGVQLLPTWELSQLSVRAQGLPFRERLSFSLSPWYVGRALLPAFGRPVSPEHLEYVAYVGTTGLALAMVGLLMDLDRRGKKKGNGDAHHPTYVLILLGVLFALGLYNPLYVVLARYVPGFAHFRVPARWLALYAIGVAALTGRAVQWLWERRRLDRRRLLIVMGTIVALLLWAVVGLWLDGDLGSDARSVTGWVGVVLGATGLLWIAATRARLATIGLLVMLIGELLLASRTLPRARATAPQAFTSLRPAVAHLLASEGVDDGQRGRFLSMSDITFDPGDLSLIRRVYGPQLSDDQLYDYVVATKQKEVLSPNLPLAFDVAAVDGYDGGLLPLERYVTLQQLFLPSEAASIDGRLRENLTAIPEGRWLSLFNVRYVITDKLRDAWIDDIFYDLQFSARLSHGEGATVAHVPGFEATALGVVSHLESGIGLPDGAPVGVVQLWFADGDVQSFEVQAGLDVVQGAADQPVGETMATRLRWSEPARPVTITVKATTTDGAWVVRGMSLIDERTDSFQSLVLSDRGRFRLVHSGDVKMYENVNVLPRAFIVPHAEAIRGDEAALRAMKDPAFDPASQVVLSDEDPACRLFAPEGATADDVGSATTAIEAYGPEQVVVKASLDRPGYLVLTDAHYPGWQATVDGTRVPICRADVLFRAVALEAGEHHVIFTFRPPLQRLGVVISMLALAVLIVIWHERHIVESVVRCYNRMQR